MSKTTISDLGTKRTHNDITFNLNRYVDTPTMEVTLRSGERAYLSPFRGYRFQVSEDDKGCGYIAASMTNTRMCQLAHCGCAHAILMHLACEALERAGAEPFSAKMMHIFIDESIEWLLKNEAKIYDHNTNEEAYDDIRGKCRSLIKS